MTEGPFGSRRYNEKEVALLLKRASDLQRTVPTARDRTGLTLHELEEIATEAGLDAALLRRAAAELDAGLGAEGSSPGTRLAGAPLRVLLERKVPGELPTAAFADLLPLVLAAADSPGNAIESGQTFTWTSQDPSNLRRLQVLIATGAGWTRIHIEERYGGLAGAVFGGGLGGIGGGVGGGLGGALGGALGSLTLGLGIPAVVLGTTYVGCRIIFRRLVARRRVILERLLREIEEAVPPPPAERLPPC